MQKKAAVANFKVLSQHMRWRLVWRADLWVQAEAQDLLIISLHLTGYVNIKVGKCETLLCCCYAW